ncbi:MAG: DUF262 domain-containing protein [Bacteroidales bacterium]|nr:DUF262 domain-containing protein [Bacteroidales bacterium]
MNTDYLYNCVECSEDFAIEKICNTCIKEYTLADLLAEYSGGILIPKIQRDYAQGRSKTSDNGQAELVRKGFLDYLFKDPEQEKSLDFVFGTSKRKEGKNWFIPIDGQQRLTTLFLLILYQAKTNKQDIDLLKKFSYDTRRAARDFVKAIVDKNWNIDSNKSISYSLKKSNWFMDYWQYDPTVDSMLRMLDAIHDKQNVDQNTQYPDLKKIKFYFFDMQAHGLDENLYLKMNSRGKPLTPFENLKANIEGLLDDPKFNKIDVSSCFEDIKILRDKDGKPLSFKDHWTYYLDRDWTDWFWNNRPDKESNHLIDKEFTQFICRFIAGYWHVRVDVEYDELCLEYKNNINIYFEKIKEVLDEDVFCSLAKVLMGFSCQDWQGSTVSSWEEKISQLDEYKSLAIIQAYLISEDDEDLLRFAWNMSENYVNGADNYLNFCNILRELKPIEKGPFIERLAAYKPKGKINAQLQEEIDKAIRILSPTQDNADWDEESLGQWKGWRAAIVQAESYKASYKAKDKGKGKPFLKGAIRFLYYSSDAEEHKNWSLFARKFKQLDSLFSNDDDRLTAMQSFIDYVPLEFWCKKYWFDYKGLVLWKKIFTDSEYQKHVSNYLTRTEVSKNSCKDKLKELIKERNYDEEKKYYWLLKDWNGVKYVYTCYTNKIPDPKDEWYKPLSD